MSFSGPSPGGGVMSSTPAYKTQTAPGYQGEKDAVLRQRGWVAALLARARDGQSHSVTGGSPGNTGGIQS